VEEVLCHHPRHKTPRFLAKAWKILCPDCKQFVPIIPKDHFVVVVNAASLEVTEVAWSQVSLALLAKAIVKAENDGTNKEIVAALRKKLESMAGESTGTSK
jgi:thiol-disulfide isomerase/thioredoxin